MSEPAQGAKKRKSRRRRPSAPAAEPATGELIRDTAGLASFLARQVGAPFVTVDTEFMRERTYWPQLCLIQVAGPDEAAAIDPMSPDLDLAPFFELMANRDVLKVVHAGRQDVEIFLNLSGKVPQPLFDTQIAAMVCGFGESIGYDSLVKSIVHVDIDKGSRFTDWSNRPLTDAQIAYALGDVTYLRDVYRHLSARLNKQDRADWVAEEMRILTDPDTYRTDPEEAWQRLRPRSENGRYLAVLREVAAWREREAQRKDVPRARILKDETLLDIAAQMPTTRKKLAKTRGIPKGFAEGRSGAGLIEAVEAGLAIPDAQLPPRERRVELPSGIGPMVELLKVLLKLRCEEHHVAAKLVASADDLRLIAADDHAEVLALQGWRREVFGADALALKKGKLALKMSKKSVVVVEV